jgi:hypothetical protein
MNKNILNLLYLVTSGFVFTACEKNNLDAYEKAQDLDLFQTTQVRFIHAFPSNAINTASPVSITTAPPPFDFFVNGQRLNGVTLAGTSPSNLTFYFGAFPGVNTTTPTTNGNNGSLNNTGGAAASTVLPDYAVVSGGNLRLAAVLNRLTGASPADTVIAGNFNLANGKKYTVIAADTIPNQRFYLFEDSWYEPNASRYLIRFINMAPNITIPAFDVFSRRTGGYLITGLTYRSATTYLENSVIGTRGLTNDTLELRATGTTTTIAQFNSFFPVSQRVYTFVIRGLTNLPSSNPRSLALAGYLNR